MQLTGKQIVAENIVTNVGMDSVQQQGVDVRVENIYRIDDNSSGGYIPVTGKTRRPKMKEIDVNETGKYYYLPKGWYEVDLMEGCDINSNRVLNFKTRSSLVRCGAVVHSGQFDAGFATDKMGCFLHVIYPITIERGARIAQAIVHETYDVEENNLYNGQWQGDKQRKE